MKTTFAATARTRLASYMLALGVGISACVWSVSLARAQAEMTTIPVSVVTTLVQQAFNGTTVRLNGFGTVANPGVLNGSEIRLGPRLGGARQQFTTFPAFQPRKPYYFYVSDVNLRRITVSQDRQFIRVGLIFEEDGVELKGICRGSATDCPFGRDDSTPDIQIRDFRIDVLLEPWAVDNSVSYRRALVHMRGEPQAGGICRLPGDPCNVLTHYKSKVRQGTEATLQTFLQQAAIRSSLAAAIRSSLRTSGIGQVFFVQIRGGNLEIYHRP